MKRIRPGLLITGAPRSGTKYATEVLREQGVDACHEERGTVTVSWMEAFNASAWGGPVIHLVRNPIHVIASMMTVHEDYLRRYVPGPWPAAAEPLERRAIAWCRITDAVDIGANCAHSTPLLNVERLEEQLGVTSSMPRDLNTRAHKSIEWDDLLAFDCGWYIAESARRYGYDSPRKGDGK